MKSHAVLLTSLLALVGCGGGENPDLNTPAVDGVDFKGSQVVVLEGADTLTFSDDGVQGTGTFRFGDLFDKVESAKNYVARFELQPGSEIRFFSHGKDDLTRGIEVSLSRDAQGVWSGKVDAGSQSFEFPPGVIEATESEIYLSFDVHNDHGSTTHLVFWTQETGLPVFEDIVYERGYGVFYGVELNQANLKQLSVLPPREVH